ncbi:MAG: FapA family protein [Nitrospinota bacterium]
MANILIFDLPSDMLAAVSGQAPLEEVLQRPVPVKANQVFGIFIKEGAPVPDEHKDKVKWEMPDGVGLKEVCGEGVEVKDSDPPTAVSTKNGLLIGHELKMKITGIYEVRGDVTAKGGNIKTPTSVLIHGTVSGNVEIEAGGDVEVRGLIEEAVIKAKGNIIAKGGMTGGDKGKLTAGKSIYCQFVQQASLETPGNIVVDGVVMNSNILCGKRLIIRGTGYLVGGKTSVREGIEAVKVGSEAALLTDVELGCDPFKKTRMDRLKEGIGSIEKDVETITTSTKHIQNELDGLATLSATDLVTSLFKTAEIVQQQGDDLDPERLEKLNKFGSGIMRLIRMKDEIEVARKKLQEVQEGEIWFDKARFKVTKIAHPGTTISIHGVSRRLEQEYEKVVFYYKPKEGEIGESYL